MKATFSNHETCSSTLENKHVGMKGSKNRCEVGPSAARVGKPDIIDRVPGNLKFHEYIWMYMYKD